MMENTDTLNWLKSIRDSLRASQCEFVFEQQRIGLTRFASNRIHQVSETEHRILTVRKVVEGKLGSYSTTRFDQDSISHALRHATSLASLLPKAETPVELAEEGHGIFTKALDWKTAHLQPFERAHIVSSVLSRRSCSDDELSGALITSHEITSVVNTEGTETLEERSTVTFNLVAQRGKWSARSYWAGWRIDDLPLDQLCKEVSLANREEEIVQPSEVPGDLPVLLDYLAVGQLVGFLGYIAFGAKAFLDGTSFLRQSLGQKVCSDQISLYEDPESVIPVGFDYEGVPRKHVTLIDNGIARGLVTDKMTAKQLELATTGNAPSPESVEGPQPERLVLKPGDSTFPSMLSRIEKGIYVRDLHYVNVAEPLSTTITGMTRHGTFLIRQGELTNRLPDLRFQVRILDVLDSVLALGSSPRPAEGVTGFCLVPPLLCERFQFIGATSE